MEDLLARLLAVLDALAHVARMMHPRRLDALVDGLGNLDTALQASVTARPTAGDPVREQIQAAAALALRACDGLRAAPQADNPTLAAYRAMRSYSRATEALAQLAETLPAVGRYLLEPAFRNDPKLLSRLTMPPAPGSGLFHSGNETTERGGFSVYVPPWYDAAVPTPLIMALHGGAGHGRLFLWNWVPEARARSMIVVAPTAIGSTWSLMDPEIDSANLNAILGRVQQRWNIDPKQTLLTGMSDGGTFTLISGVARDCPFTHLAPVAASFDPIMLALAEPDRLTGLPIHLTHGAQDWMFPVSMARTASRAYRGAGAAITYREIADLSHAYPRDDQGEVLDWFNPLSAPSRLQ